MSRRIVIHFNPDLDAITGVWLLKRWLPEWENAEVEFVPAGKTYEGMEVDSNPEVLHVDTGLGKFDHHQTGDYTCAAKLTLEYIRELSNGGRIGDIREIRGEHHKEKIVWNGEALERLVEVVNQVDHFQEVYYKDSEADYLVLGAEYVLDGWKLLYREQDGLIVERGLELLDGIYISIVSKVLAEKILEEKGEEFETRWGKGIAVETKNSAVMDIAQKRGYAITVRKHPVTGHARVKSPPVNKMKDEKGKMRVDLTSVYEALRRADSEADWFLHSSKTMLLNGSSKNPKMRATNLSLEEVVDIVKNAAH